MTPPAPARQLSMDSWLRLQPPAPLPRTVTPMPHEAIHHYLRRLADANHQAVSQISHLIHVRSPALPPGADFAALARERLAAASGQPPARIRRLYWGPAPGATSPSGQPEEYGHGLRPACRRCAARHGLLSPVPCKHPDHQMICRHHRLWTGPGVWQPADQHDVSPFPEVLRAQRRHDQLMLQHPPQTVRDAYKNADHAWRQHPGPRPRWTPGQFHRFSTVITESQRVPQPGQGLNHAGLRALAATIAIYPDVVQLTAVLLDPRCRRQCWPGTPPDDNLPNA